MQKIYFDFTDNLLVDTYLSVKIGNVFVHYIIPRVRKDGTYRRYGDLYKYFTQKEGFRMALGYILTEDESKQFWMAQMQYMYFDKKTAPYMTERLIERPLIRAK